MWASIERLVSGGVMGINRRNADYILRYNPRHLNPLVDDKLITKRLAAEAGIPVPELDEVIALYGQIKGLPAILERHRDFVIKPAKGSQGKGIWVFSGQHNHKYRKTKGKIIDWDELLYHISNILSGVYSLGGQPDTGYPLRGLRLPHWDLFLELAAQCYEFTRLGYLGVDFVLDRDRGPLLLEINARPGLSIQIANQEGLLKRLQLVERYREDLITTAECCAFAKYNFSIETRGR
ncbi:MAG: hypothetical protein KJ558_08825 [Gammaproteobacteria bacterium]|nr:hypothetical protein [Gammaproteobacteria bacterium]MBU1654911.1 hypothetical protein [Gammaproteobacteria bacterium]MBU1960360.1 hypothetical protein [Gammaproteobacteria bacterium]